MTLWDKDAEVEGAILAFSAGNEYQLDHRLVPHDCKASLAHARMLGKIGLLEAEIAKDRPAPVCSEVRQQIREDFGV